MDLTKAQGTIFVIGVIILGILFGGEPDIADSLMRWINKQ